MTKGNNTENFKNLGKITEKEIYEIPQCIRRLTQNIELINFIAKKIVNKRINHIYLIGAGSSYHAGFAMSYMFNRITQIPTYTEYSMEFQYLILPILKKKDCVIGISQSGATKDTLESMKISKNIGCLTIGITNNSDSELAKISNLTINLNCGNEESVLATKTYVATLAIMAMISLEIGKENNTISFEEYDKIRSELIKIPDKISSILHHLHNQIKVLSKQFISAKFCFILGSGPEYATAMEAALKLKEGARIFGQAFSTAEFPHGPITLVDSDTYIIAIIPYEDNKRKQNILNLLTRIRERGAEIFGVYEIIEDESIPESLSYGIEVPNTVSDLQPLIMILAIQLLTLEVSRINGINCDTPKFLSKVSGI